MNRRMDTLKNKKILLVAAALVLFAGTGVGVYYVLRSAQPKNEIVETDQPNSKTDLSEKATKLDEEGRAAMDTNDPATAVKKFTEAKKLYTDAGETEKVEQMTDQLALAEHEAEVQKSNTQVQAPSRGTAR